VYLNFMEKMRGLNQKISETGQSLARTYCLARKLETLKDTEGCGFYEFQAATFKIDDLISGLHKSARARFRDMEEMGQRHMAREIMEEVDALNRN